MTRAATMGERIRAARTAARMSQDALADALGTTKTTVSNWERDVMNPRVELLPAIRKALDVSLDHLICGDMQPTHAMQMLRASEPTLSYNQIPGPARTHRAQQLALLFDELNEVQQKILLDVARNMSPAVRKPEPKAAKNDH